MPIYSQMPIRLEASLVSSPPVAPIDQNTGLAPAFWRGQPLALNVGIFDADGNAVDLSNLQYLQLTLQPLPGSLVPSLSAQVLAGSIIPTITRADWNAGTAQQAVFILSGAQLDLSLNGMDTMPYWLTLSGLTTGNGTIVYAAGYVNVFDPGSLLPPPVSGVVSANAQGNAGGDFIVTPTAQIHHEEITITGAAGTRRCVVRATGLATGALVALRFKLPATADIIIQVYDQATSGALLTTITSAADGFTPTARTQLWFDGANLKRDFEVIPANGQST